MSRNSFTNIPFSHTTFVNIIKKFLNNQNAISKETNLPVKIQSALLLSIIFSSLFFFFSFKRDSLPHLQKVTAKNKKPKPGRNKELSLPPYPPFSDLLPKQNLKFTEFRQSQTPLQATTAGHQLTPPQHEVYSITLTPSFSSLPHTHK